MQNKKESEDIDTSPNSQSFQFYSFADNYASCRIKLAAAN